MLQVERVVEEGVHAHHKRARRVERVEPQQRVRHVAIRAVAGLGPGFSHMWSVLSYGIIVNTGRGQHGAGILTYVVDVILWYYSRYGPWPAGGRDSHICGRCYPMVLQ